MSEIINLNRMRKAKARAEKAREAADNRIRFGRSKAEKSLDQKRSGIDTARHEGHRLPAKREEEE